MPSLADFLDARQENNTTWRFGMPQTIHGAFGGAFGGAIAAAAVFAARSVAPDRVPNALDCRFLRGLRAGEAVATTTVLNAGRTLSTISVDIEDESGRLCTRATVSLIDPSVLYDFEFAEQRPGDWKNHEEASKWPAIAPIVEVIDSRIVGNDERGVATAVRVPWDHDPTFSAEATCMAADMSVGPPVGAAVPAGVGSPNPDISMRFCGEVTTEILVGACRIDRATSGLAATRIEVYSGDDLVANGISTTLLLPAP